jgi:dTDP-4-dehydrorhamnose reductase
MTPPRVLITGATGLLGKALLESSPAGWEVWGTWHRLAPPEPWRARCVPMSLADAASMAEAVRSTQPAVVIHTAGEGRVDQAERQPEATRAVNVDATARLAELCRRDGRRLVYISSNAVFDGAQPPYGETSPTSPINVYGRQKTEAEALVRAALPAAIIIRPILMYGWPWPGGRDNAVTRWLRAFDARESVAVADDIVSMPLSVDTAAEAVWAAVAGERDGTYHLAGADRLTLAVFARQTAEVFGHDPSLVRPVASASMPGLAPRPKDTSFDVTKMRQQLGVTPVGAREGLMAMARRRVPAVCGV